MQMRGKPRKAAPIVLLTIFTATAMLFWSLFYERYVKYADCIGAAKSSCLTPEGDNLTSGGMLWGLLAVPFTVLAAFCLLVSIHRLARR